MGEPVLHVRRQSVPRKRRSHRDPEDDFFCIRYQVWYPSFDCAIRTKFQTSDGCKQCEQGCFNLKQHASALQRSRLRFPQAR